MVRSEYGTDLVEARECRFLCFVIENWLFFCQRKDKEQQVPKGSKNLSTFKRLNYSSTQNKPLVT